MNDAFMWGVLSFWCFMVIIDATITVRDHFSSSPRSTFVKAWNFAYRPTYIICTFVIALDGVMEREWFTVGIYTFYGSVMAWAWWNDDENKRRRRKLRQKLAERVKDMGGKLAVVRPSEG